MGMQYRKELGSDRGNDLFVPVRGAAIFWMKNTPIPLDMIFINRERKMSAIVEADGAFSLDSRSVGRTEPISCWRSMRLGKTVSPAAGAASASKAFRPDCYRI